MDGVVPAIRVVLTARVVPVIRGALHVVAALFGYGYRLRRFHRALYAFRDRGECAVVGMARATMGVTVYVALALDGDMRIRAAGYCRFGLLRAPVPRVCGYCRAAAGRCGRRCSLCDSGADASDARRNAPRRDGCRANVRPFVS